MKLVIYLNYNNNNKGGDVMENWQMDVESFNDAGCAVNND